MEKDPYTIDRQSMLRGYAKAAKNYEQEAVLQTEVRQQLLQRLSITNLKPAVILDVGCGVASALPELKSMYPDANVLGLDLCHEMLKSAKDPNCELVCGDFEQLPIATDAVNMIFANLSLHCAQDIDTAFAELQRVLKPEGLLCFTIFGPDTLRELRDAWRAVDDNLHIHRFFDMHDLGDAVIRHGFSEPVLDVDYIKLAYQTPHKAMRDLKLIGESNSARGRNKGLTGTRTFQRLLEQCQSSMDNQQFLSTFEVVFGQAWGRSQINQTKYMEGEVHIPLSQLKRG